MTFVIEPADKKFQTHHWRSGARGHHVGKP